MQKKHNLTEQDLETLLFLYSQGLFTYYDFKEYTNCMSWDMKRFKRLKDEGWIHVFSDKHRSQYNLYEMTRKGRYAITTMYKHLNMIEPIPMDPQHNPFIRSTSFADKTILLGIRAFNDAVKEKNGYKIDHY